MNKALTREEIQEIYDNEIKKVSSISFTEAIAKDYSIWIKAQNRLLELYPELLNSFDPDDSIQSRY
ncbi:hypothetical protein [Lactococcus lactis]|uniref:hypothetical protein n=1 Tax=Lactococcus lactis TaxID=1358 RepID=UPI0022E19431|nr:hypothetical protein [Lactococcus lactis]